jgi:hypothetical protein
MADHTMKKPANQRSNDSQQRNAASNGARRLTDEQWNQLHSQLKQHWGQLDDQAVLATQGDLAKLTTLIEQQTGENRQRIETTLRRLIDREPESEGSAGSRTR